MDRSAAAGPDKRGFDSDYAICSPRGLIGKLTVYSLLDDLQQEYHIDRRKYLASVRNSRCCTEGDPEPGWDMVKLVN